MQTTPQGTPPGHPAAGNQGAANASGPPLNATTPGASPAMRQDASRVALLLFAIIVSLMVFAAIGITGFFRLNSEASSLRSSALFAIPGAWDKIIAVRVGWFTTALVRTGSRFFQMPPEPRAALDTLRGASVAVYKLRNDPAMGAETRLLRAADNSMKSEGWERIVGVVQERQVVAVYCPRRKFSQRNVRCCVLVFQERNLVVVSASGNLEPLIELARTAAKKEFGGHLKGEQKDWLPGLIKASL